VVCGILLLFSVTGCYSELPEDQLIVDKQEHFQFLEDKRHCEDNLKTAQSQYKYCQEDLGDAQEEVRRTFGRPYDLGVKPFTDLGEPDLVYKDQRIYIVPIAGDMYALTMVGTYADDMAGCSYETYWLEEAEETYSGYRKRFQVNRLSCG